MKSTPISSFFLVLYKVVTFHNDSNVLCNIFICSYDEDINDNDNVDNNTCNNTCHSFLWFMQAAEICWRSGPQQAGASNCAVARSSILGLHFFNSHAKVIQNTVEMCAITHPDPRYST